MQDVASRYRLRPVALVAIAVFGGIVGAGWDLFHVHTATIVYAHERGGQPWWVPLEFALVYVVGVLAIVRLGRPAPDSRSPVRLLAEGAWVTTAYATTAWLHQYEWLVAGLLAVALVVRNGTVRDVVRQNPVAATLVVAGPMVESVLVAAGVFDYTHASLGAVAVWLPLLYANAVPFAVRLSETALHRWGEPA